MEEIKVGEYVRTRKGYIFKIEHKKMIQGLKFLDAQYGTIVKHSKNIIDLIECGDYVNGRLVLQTDCKNQNVCLLIPFTDTKANINIAWYGYEDIKTILTKEQFEQNSYKVGGKIC